jgi:hypothetical protein
MSEYESKIDAQEPDTFELALTQAMCRVDAPEGFADRIMERAASPAVATAKIITMRPRFQSLASRAWVGGAIAAALVLGVFGVEQVHVRRERERAALATQQFEMATRITDETLAHTREQLQKAGVPLE